MKIAFVVEIDLDAIKAEDTLMGWQRYMQDELGIEEFAEGDENAWEQVAAAVGMQYLAAGDNATFVKSNYTTTQFVEVEVDPDDEIVEDHKKQGL